jgi:hypothetical protein
MEYKAGFVTLFAKPALQLLRAKLNGMGYKPRPTSEPVFSAWLVNFFGKKNRHDSVPDSEKKAA